eukprot:432385_1
MSLNQYNAFTVYDMSFNKEYNWPSCDFWNVNNASWDTYGCFVYDITNTTVTCGCSHLTSFSLSSNKIIPQATVLTELDWRRLNMKNLLKFPIVWITVLSILMLFTVIGYINPRSGKINTKSIMAFQDIIYKSTQDEKLWKDVFGKEIKYISQYIPNQNLLGGGIRNIAAAENGTKSLCVLSWKLFKVYLRNDHTLLSVFQRTGGTNFSSKQRLGCFFMYFSTIMVCTGMFYGLQQSTPIQDILASFTISLCSTLPVLITKKLFEKSKPIQVFHNRKKHSLVHTLDLDDILDENEFEEEEESNNLEQNNHLDVEEFVSQLTKKDDLTMGMISQEIEMLYGNNEENKIAAISQIRKVLFASMFPLPYKCKNIAWIIIIIWSITACITAIVYGLSFDINYMKKGENELYDEECWNKTLKLQIESILSETDFDTKYVQHKIKNTSSYGGSDSSSWLLSIFQSLMTSLILWQPLTVWVFTWIKIWAFTWHLKMKVNPSNLMLLCKRCCCGYEGNTDDEIELKRPKSKIQILSDYVSGKIVGNKRDYNKVSGRTDQKIREVVAHKNRPLDIISFLGNDDWIINDILENNDDKNNKNDNELLTGQEEEEKEKELESQINRELEMIQKNKM